MGAPCVGSWPQPYGPSRTGTVRNSCDGANRDDGDLRTPAEAPLAAPDPPRLAGRRAREPARGLRPHDPPGRRAAAESRAIRSRPRPGPLGGYRLHAGAAMPPLLLDDDEAVAIAVGLRTAAGTSVAGIEDTALRALVKLEQVLPSHLRRRVQAMQAVTSAMPGGGPDRRRRGAHGHRDRDARPRARPLRLPGARRQREPAAGRAALAREPRPPLVPRRLGLRPPRVADLPHGPRRAPAARRLALPAARAAGRRPGRVRLREPDERAAAPPGAAHAPRLRRRAARPPSVLVGAARADRRATAASTAPATTRWSGSRCASACSASTSRSTSRRSSSTRWPRSRRGSAALRARTR